MCLLGTVGQRGILQFLGKCPTAVSENKLASTQKSALGGIPLTLEVICNTLPGVDLRFLRWHYIPTFILRTSKQLLGSSWVSETSSLAYRSSPIQRFLPWACGGGSWVSATQTPDPYKPFSFYKMSDVTAVAKLQICSFSIYSKAPSTDSIWLTKYVFNIQGAGLNWKACKMCIHPSALLHCCLLAITVALHPIILVLSHRLQEV